MKKKLRIGWFSFTCCEDSTIVFTEILNDYYFKWKEYLDIVYFRALKGKNEISNMDVAFVEGAISSVKQAEELQKIRKSSKKLIAIGSCAVMGKPSGVRNDFSPEVLKKFEEIYKTMKYSKKVKKLNDVIHIDDSIAGCPMKSEEFVAKMESLIGLD